MQTNNEHGGTLESQISALLIRKKYIQIIAKHEQDIDYAYFISQHRGFKTLYQTQMRLDFLLFHPTKFPEKLAIECKWQSSTGSVDEKFPYLTLNMKALPIPSIILIAGGGYSKNSMAWLKQQETDRFTVIDGMDKIIKWANSQL